MRENGKRGVALSIRPVPLGPASSPPQGTDDEDDVLGGCIADAPPTGNMAACEQSVCVAYMPGGSCLAPFGEDAETSQGADIQSDEDAGPDTQNAPSYDVSE